jgi:glycosyltransferase involved in cell wall biosynthesis
MSCRIEKIRAPRGVPIVPVTVVMPTIDGRDELRQRALDSVYRQTAQPAEVVIVFDVDRRGAYHARNEALESVQTTWIAWLDDDDRLLDNHLEVLLGAADASEADLVYSYAEFIGGRDPLATDDGTGRWVLPFGIPFGPAQEAHLRTHGNFIPVTHLVRAEAVRAVGGMPRPFSWEFGREEDYGLLIRLLDAGYRFHHVAEKTWEYHIHGGNTGGQPDTARPGIGGGGALFRDDH